MEYKELVNLGLSEKEAKVYLASLELGKSTVQEIAKRARVKRVTTYVQIENLTKKGLMSTSTEGKKQFYYAEDPEKLSLLFREQALNIQRKQDHLKKILPELKSLNKESFKNKPFVRYFEGKDGMRAIAEELFGSMTKEKEVKMIYSYDLLLKMFTKQEIEEMRKKRQNKSIKAKIITNDKDKKLTTDGKVKRISSYKYKIKSDIAIFGNKVRMVTQEGERSGLIIDNKQIAETLSILFDLAWENDKKRSEQKRQE